MAVAVANFTPGEPAFLPEIHDVGMEIKHSFLHFEELGDMDAPPIPSFFRHKSEPTKAETQEPNIAHEAEGQDKLPTSIFAGEPLPPAPPPLSEYKYTPTPDWPDLEPSNFLQAASSQQRFPQMNSIATAPLTPAPCPLTLEIGKTPDEFAEYEVQKRVTPSGSMAPPPLSLDFGVTPDFFEQCVDGCPPSAGGHVSTFASAASLASTFSAAGFSPQPLVLTPALLAVPAVTGSALVVPPMFIAPVMETEEEPLVPAPLYSAEVHAMPPQHVGPPMVVAPDMETEEEPPVPAPSHIAEVHAMPPMADALPQNALKCLVSSSGTTHIHWAIDSRKLESADRQLVSPQFEINFPNLGPQPFKMIVLPKVSGDGKKHSGFKKSKGRGRVELKCEAQFPEDDSIVVDPLVFCIGAGRGSKMQQQRGPVSHNFADQCLAGLQKDDEEWDFNSVVDESRTFVVSLQVAPLPGAVCSPGDNFQWN